MKVSLGIIRVLRLAGIAVYGNPADPPIVHAHMLNSTFAVLGGEGRGVFPGQPEDADFLRCQLVRARWLKSGGDDGAAAEPSWNQEAAQTFFPRRL